MDPSVARNTLRSSTRHWAQFFSGRPGPGFSPPAIVPNVIRRISRSLCLRCTPPAKGRRRLRMLVSTLSHCAFVRALAYDMRWSVRCRQWKPMIRRRNLWCAVRSSDSSCRGSTLRTRTAGFLSPRPCSMRTFRANGAASISYSSRLNLKVFVEAPPYYMRRKKTARQGLDQTCPRLRQGRHHRRRQPLHILLYNGIRGASLRGRHRSQRRIEQIANDWTTQRCPRLSVQISDLQMPRAPWSPQTTRTPHVWTK